VSESRRAESAALVTGASSGIGRELAILLAREKYPVILTARNTAPLEQLAGDLNGRYAVRCIAVPADLSRPESAEAIISHAERAGFCIDFLVNNAGYGVGGDFAKSEPGEVHGQIDLNITGLVSLTRLTLPGMLARRRGRILNVASTAGFAPGPGMAVYYATKAFVVSFSESLSEECRNTGVTITALCPGPTRTGFQRRAGIDRINLTRRFFMMNAAEVAEAGLRAAQSGKVLAIPGLLNKLLVRGIQYAPRWSVRSAVRVLNSEYRQR